MKKKKLKQIRLLREESEKRKEEETREEKRSSNKKGNKNREELYKISKWEGKIFLGRHNICVMLKKIFLP